MPYLLGLLHLLLISIIFRLIIKKTLHKSNNINFNTYHTRGGLSYKNNNCVFEKKTINYKEVDYFRDIPCGDDIFRAYWLIYNYQLGEKDEDLIIALFLKWVRDENIKFEKRDENNIIHFVKNPQNCNEIEKDIYSFLFQASFGNHETGFKIDNELSVDEFKIWYSKNYSKVSEWFNRILDYEVDSLIKEGKIKIEKNRKHNYNLRYIVDNAMTTEAIKVAGLKRFLTDFTIIKDRESLEVKLFNNYLIYATLFGLADKVYENFEELYPETFDINIDDYIVSYNDLSLIEFIFNKE